MGRGWGVGIGGMVGEGDDAVEGNRGGRFLAMLRAMEDVGAGVGCSGQINRQRSRERV